MATQPDQVRAGLVVVTAAAAAEARAVAAKAPRDAAGVRAALFATVPLIIDHYAPGAAALALDWYEEIREEAAPVRAFTPTPRLKVTDDDVSAMVARTTEVLHEMEQGFQADLDAMVAESMAKLEAEMQKEVASGFWDSIIDNTTDDPSTAGWQRFAKPGACKFCLLLAARGAVYRKSTVNFAAHTSCHCVVGPSFDPDAPKADVMQYVASRRKRGKADRAKLREYLNHNFPDAPG